MYNDIIMIIISVLAVYGAYALIREVAMLFSRKHRIVAAIRIKDGMLEDNDAIVVAEQYIASHSFLERTPVLICEREVPKDIENYGYDVYIKFTEET